MLGATGANLTVSEGEISVLMGLSGSGKSTLLRAVNGLNKVTRGEVLVKDGDRMVDVASCDEATLRHIRQKQVAMVFQQFALLPWRTVRENVGFGLELAGVPEAERNAKVDQQLALVGLDQWANKYVHELSGGMQQRVGLARAFATEAPILLMDEPFSALDPLIRTKLQDELLELQKASRRPSSSSATISRRPSRSATASPSWKAAASCSRARPRTSCCARPTTMCGISSPT